MITYNAQGTQLPELDETRVSVWLHRIAAGYDRVVGDVNYIFVDDETMLDINRRFIGHDYYTDHIGFDYSEGRALSGDIYISTDTVRTNAELFQVPYAHELLRIVAHGLLHLCGVKDKTAEERETMQQAEDKALELWTNLT